MIANTCAQCGCAITLGKDGACTKCSSTICTACWEGNGHKCPKCIPPGDNPKKTTSTMTPEELRRLEIENAVLWELFNTYERLTDAARTKWVDHKDILTKKLADEAKAKGGA